MRCFWGTSISSWPRLLHRRLYYRLIMGLEKRVYTKSKVSLAAVSGLVAEEVRKHYQASNVRIIRNGVDTEIFSAARRIARRGAARQVYGLGEEDFVLLLI